LQLMPRRAEIYGDRHLRLRLAGRHTRGIVRGCVPGSGQSLAHVVQVRQVDKGQDTVGPGAGLLGTVSAIGFPGPLPTPTATGQVLISRLTNRQPVAI
jgi:hypothetical protein